jgi:general secretion pathway protein D
MRLDRNVPRVCIGGRMVLTVGLFLATLAGVVAESVDFTFDGVDVATFVKVVGQVTGRRFVVDGELEGAVTVVSPDVPRADVYPLAISILESVGYSVIEQGGVSRVVALSGQGARLGKVVGADGALPSDGIVTKVIRLQYVSPTVLRNMLASMGGAAGKTVGIGAVEESSHLVVTDTVANIRRLEQVVAEIDLPGLMREMEVIPLTYADAEELADEINRALGESETRAQRLRKRLGSETPGQEMSAVVASPQANALVAIGTRSQVASIRDLIVKMDVDVSSGRGRLNAIFLRYIDAEEAATSIMQLLEKRAAGKGNGGGKVALQANVSNNALLVDGSPAEFEAVRKLIDQLDQVPNQVLIEVRILEYSSKEGKDIGFTLAAVDAPEGIGDSVVQGSVALGDQGPAVLNAVQQGVFPGGLTIGVASGVRLGGDGNLVLGYPGVLNIDALVTEGDFKVVSETSLQAQDNREATISIVNEIPILKSTIEGGSGTSRDVIQNIERIDVGIKLAITPHVIPGSRDVSMELAPSIEAVIESNSDNALTPTIAKREVTSMVRVADGDTAVIAGLTRRDEQDAVSRVPYISRIPLIGQLFRRTVKRDERTDLLILVTPHITTEPDESARARERLQGVTGLGASGEANEE